MNTRVSGSRTRSRLLLSACFAVAMGALAAPPAQAIIVRDDVGLDASVDANDQYPAVVQLFDWDVGDLYGGGAGGIYYNCTGTLINPRTILTAAHCVTNEGFTGSEDWGAPGDAPLTKIISFGVDTSTRLFNFIDSDTLLSYNEGGPAFSTDVIIHPSAELTHGDQPFPWADTALIAMDEPVTDVNPMGMLLSPLTSLTHVVQIGYGTYGTGTTGQQGISTIRLMGENMLGILGSDSDFIDGVFPGYAPSSVTIGIETQVEYYTDFDNPNRPSANAGCTFSAFDINCVDDAAVENIDYFPGDALAHEVTTAPGDSGGPLIADQLGAGVPALVIGNLSGGWSFFGTPSDEYGGNGTSFYQPLFAEWQFLIQNDPYKYVGAKAGDGAWEDPNHWVQLQDPNMFIIDGNGNIVTGTPTGTECGVYQTTPKIGTVLGTDISGNSTDSSPYYFPPPGGDCGVTSGGGSGGTPAGVPGGSTPVSGSSVTASAGTATENSDVSHSPVTQNGNKVTTTGKTIASNADAAFLSQYAGHFSSPSAQADGPVYPAGSSDPQDYGSNLPQSSPLLGPGSTGFVPENTNGTVGVAYQNPAQYFDVTLSEDGTTSLSTYYIEIDRLTMEGNAGLDVTSEGGLLSNIDIELYDNAQLNNDGVVGTTDIIADGGTVSGNGTYILGASVVPTDLAAIVIGNGAITAGNVGTVGTMTVLGNVGVSSGGMMLVDADATTTDLIDIYGVLAMNGTVWFNSVEGVKPFWHQGGDFAFADSIVTDGMSVPDTVPGVLYPVVALTQGDTFDTLSVTLEAAPFSTEFTPHSTDALNLSEVLDSDRADHYSDLQALYSEIDTMEGDDLAGAFDQLLPNAQRGVMTGATVGMGQLGNLIGQRLGDLRFSSAAESGGSSTGFRVNRPDDLTVAMDQNAQTGVNALNSSFTRAFAGTPSMLESAAGTGAGGGVASPTDVSAAMGTMMGGWGGFFSASSINGQSRFGGKDNNLDGYAMMVGLDRLVDQRLVLGAAFSATETNVDVPFGMGGSRVRTYQGTVYGTWSDPETMVFVNGFAGWGNADISTHRIVNIGGTVFAAQGSPNGSQGTFGLTVGKAYDSGNGTWIYPRAGLEYDYFHTDAYTETGSVIAMTYSADTTRALLGRVGVEAKGDYSLTDEATVHPSAHADLVGNMGGGSGSFLAAFAAAPGGVFKVGNAGRRDLWAELGAGLDYEANANTTITLGYDATLGRSDADYGAVTGRINIKF